MSVFDVLVNRNAVVVKPKQPFIDWLNSVEPEGGCALKDEDFKDSSIYLIPECDSPEEIYDIIKQRVKFLREENKV